MKYDIIIIGSGPAGYIAAIRAGQVGLKTALIEKDQIGGMCLNWGCIPTKALIESAKFYNKLNESNDFGIEGIEIKKLSFNWKNAVLRAEKITKKLTENIENLLIKKGVEIIIGEAEIINKNNISVNNRTLETKNIIIATGSIPERVSGENPSLDIRGLYKLDKLPENIAIYGHGPVAIELAQMFNLLGKRTILVTKNRNKLIPMADKFLNDFIQNKMKEQGITIQENMPPRSFTLINANLRKAVLPVMHQEIKISEDGFLETNNNLQTSINTIYAIGDVNGKTSFAHVGSAQGIFVINHIKGIKKHMDIHNYPLNMYTVPEMAQIGFTEEELQKEQIKYKITEIPFSINGKALTQGITEGKIRILSEKKYGEVMGVQIIGENATDMIAEAAAFMEMEATIYDVAKTIHAHPTISEVFMEAGIKASENTNHS